jgi:hypothetical protein
MIEITVSPDTPAQLFGRECAPSSVLTLAHHAFEIDGRGELQHYVDGKLRATVPPEGWDDYAAVHEGADRVITRYRAAMGGQGASE